MNSEPRSNHRHFVGERGIETLLRWFIATILVCTPLLDAEVSRVEIDERTLLLDGAAFGEVGPYEKITGRLYFEFDPDNPMNRAVVDLQFAPRNAAGCVEAWANFTVLQPNDPTRRAGVGLLEVSNRGGKASLAYFNRGAYSRDPTEQRHFGDGLLMRHGLTVIWIGWQWDVPPGEDQLRLHVPVAKQAGGSIEGLVRSDWTVEEATHTLPLSHRNHATYPVADPADERNVLTARTGRDAPRRIMARDMRRFARDDDGLPVADAAHVWSEHGFQPGRIYELTYVAQDPRVVGLGLAAIRDTMSWARHDPDCPFPVKRSIAFGVSQTGRFLRHFLYQGFNTDEAGRSVFDGMLIHTAGGGRGSFNHRFAQPSRDAHRYSAFFYPTDLFPFSGRTQHDPVTGRADGLFAHEHDATHRPRVMYTNTGYEYWGRAASLLHTTPDGSADVDLLANERLYHLAGAQHFVSRFPPSERSRLPDSDAYRGNPVDLLITLRALLVALVAWVADDVVPPPSSYPMLNAGNLATPTQLAWPSIRGVAAPKIAHVAYRADYGERWSQGIIDLQPPHLGRPFVTLVPQVDALGNELGGIRPLELRAPLASYAPWNLRGGEHAPEELSDFIGTFIPFAPNETERQSRSDPRPSLASLYGTRENYIESAQRHTTQMIQERILLQEDESHVLQRAHSRWDWIMKTEQTEKPTP